MIEYSEILRYDPFAMEQEAKQQLLTKRLVWLSKHHYGVCKEYRQIIDALGCRLETIRHYTELPFLPVSLFKEHALLSIPYEDVFKVVASSGTSGQAVSKLFLDRKTAVNQQKTLAKIVTDFTGASRMPMLILDSPAVLKDRSQFSARAAGILGFSIFGTDRTYALKDDMSLDLNSILAFLEKHKGRNKLLFGFTFMVWKHFYKTLLYEKTALDLSEAMLIHGGGWKTLQQEAVSNKIFRQRLEEQTGIKRIHDYYGMAEQTGSIYMECEQGHLHASTYSDILIRNPRDFSLCRPEEKGIIQVVSMLPESYPGHSLLTEDEGMILGEDNCPCGRKGKYFQVAGRLEHAEIRGCSDTYATDV